MMRKFIHKSNWLSGCVFLTLTIFMLLSACNNNEGQPLPTAVPVAIIETPIPQPTMALAVEAAVPTAEPVEVVVDAEQVVMTLWHSWQEDKAAALTEVVMAYEAEHPGVTVTLFYQANLVDAVKTAVPLGEGPDLMLMPQDQLGQFAEDGLVIPISVDFDANFMTETFTPAAVAAMSWQDNLWGIPVLQESIAIVYNKSLIDSSLIPENLVDFDTLLTNAIAYHDTNPDRYLLCNQSLSADSLDVYHAAPIFFGFGADAEVGYIDDQNQVFVNTPEHIAAGEWLLSFMEAAPAEAGYEICLDGFKSGEFASWWIGSWALDSLKEAGIDYGVRPFGRPFSHVTGLFLSPNAQERTHQEAATAFMTYFASPAVQTNLALAVNTAPANREALASDAIQANAYLAAFGEAAANGIPFSSSPYADVQWEPIGNAISHILSRVQSPEEALTEAQTAVEQAIQNAKNQ